MTVCIFNTLADTVIENVQEIFSVCFVNTDPSLDGADIDVFVSVGDMDQADNFESFIFVPNDPGMFVPITFTDGVAILETTLSVVSCSEFKIKFTEKGQYRFQILVTLKETGQPVAQEFVYVNVCD
ncbi:hypothetical protein [Cytobacillus sp. IB215316]|uniref:hypothetical protein n=1 Tax=Cytobacillus sp. IB215316 TaxID=3097354 RepID=UPI002A15A8D1|nr:hypothetical protein [Cytobacillus sp. IB215316]MDX8362698.1 hypothetical protein [Cytobacillus sp. IB215316]